MVSAQGFHDVLVSAVKVFVVDFDLAEGLEGVGKLGALDLLRGEPLRFTQRDDEQAYDHLCLSIDVAQRKIWN